MPPDSILPATPKLFMPVAILSASEVLENSPMRRLVLAPALLLFLVGTSGPAQAGPKVEKAAIEIGLDRTAYTAGSEARLAAVLTINSGWHVNSNPASFDYLIPTAVEVTLPEGWPTATTTYPPGKLQKFSFADEKLSVYDGRVALITRIPVPAGTPLGDHPVTVGVTYQACDDRSCVAPVTKDFELSLRVGSAGAAANDALFAAAATAPPSDRATTQGSLVGMLLLALLGGLILNAMPCVLPVLSLKVFGLVRTAAGGRGAVRSGALATAAGIVASFLVLAAAAMVAKLAGSAVGWGVQFQSPLFVTALLLTVLLFCLNLWGLFEIPLPRVLARIGSQGGKEGVAGHFSSGLFAALMATPCSAPFLGTAVGFALAQNSAVILAVFLALGTGMALPYLALAAAPQSARLLPRPGAWMDTFKGLMGFLLAGAGAWLLYVLSAQLSPVRLLVLEIGLLVVALFVWLRHHSTAWAAARRIAIAGLIGSLVGTLWLAASGERPPGDRSTLAAEALIPWQDFDRTQAESLAAQGRLVFVDVTADWCVTCKFNEKLVLNTPEVAAAFEQHEVLPMRADWTNRNEEIASYLAVFGKYAIPFYALYRPGSQPHVFSELLTKDSVLDAVNEAARQRLATAVPWPAP